MLELAFSLCLFPSLVIFGLSAALLNLLPIFQLNEKLIESEGNGI